MTASYKKRLGIVALIMVLLILAAVLITILTGVSRKDNTRLSIVTSFLPVYGAALQVTGDVDGVTVTNLIPPQTGCLHDYQLTPDNMITLSKADVLVLNGAGAESFLGDLKKQYPNLRIIDTSAGITLKESSHHHEEDEEHEEDEHEDDEIYNEHIWTGPSAYQKQIENLRDELIKIDPGHAEKYKENASGYIAEISALKSELTAAAAALPTKNCILFHDSLSYFADELGLQVIASLSIGEESAVSAADLAQAANAAEQAGRVLLLYDNQYNTEYSSVAQKTSFSRNLKLDMAVTDNGGKAADVWLRAMGANLRLLKEAAGS